MARLNEAPIPTESVDALKRRFIRQNRELAKNNSAQCLRIRALECDISRLLVENLNLREEILHLQGQLCAAERHVNTSSLLSVKDQLEAKLKEFGSLISDLGTLQELGSKEYESLSTNRQPDPASWRPDVPMAALNGQAFRMSDIMEERSSPGGTLRHDPARILRLSDHSNESPDLGPPPVAHFECEDPIKFDRKPQDVSRMDRSSDDGDVLPTNLSVNLETRRRRKDGQSRLEVRRSSIFPTDSDDQIQPLRTSAKRKLSVRDAEDSKGAAIKDDFVFSRRSSNISEVRGSESNDESGSPTGEKEGHVSAPTDRKVLGNKSVNMSPRKVAINKDIKNDVNKPDKPSRDAARGPGRERRTRISSVKPLPVAKDTIVETVEIAIPDEEPAATLAPKTPAPDLFSPTPSEPSVARGEGRDTPPPSGLRSTMSGSASLNGASRPSRRARAAVNYAEPNLVSKMRRPTKELSDAVSIHSRKSMSNPPASEDKDAMRTVFIKQDGSNDSGWKDRQPTRALNIPEPGSPLGRKGDGGDGINSEPEREASANTKPSAAGRAITALMSGASCSRPTDTVKDGSDLTETISKMQEMDLYDFKDSSPMDDAGSKTTAKARGSRRHSSVLEPATQEAAAKGRVSRVLAQQAPATVESASRRDRSEKKGGLEDSEGRVEGRGERVASRRRSMMV